MAPFLRYGSFVLLLAGSTTFVHAQTGVGIGTISPDGSAILDLSSTTKGVLIPRLDTAQRRALVNPAKGLLIFNTIDNRMEANIGTTTAPIWTTVTGGIQTVRTQTAALTGSGPSVTTNANTGLLTLSPSSPAPTGTITVANPATATTGQLLTINNTTGQGATFGTPSVTIPAGGARDFIFDGTNWVGLNSTATGLVNTSGSQAVSGTNPTATLTPGTSYTTITGSPTGTVTVAAPTGAVAGQVITLTNNTSVPGSFTGTNPATTIPAGATQQYVYTGSTWMPVGSAGPVAATVTPPVNQAVSGASPSTTTPAAGTGYINVTGSPTGMVTVATPASPVAGQVVNVTNGTGVPATYAGNTIPAGGGGSFIYNGTSWVPTSNQGLYTNDGTLTSTRTVDQNNNALSFNPGTTTQGVITFDRGNTQTNPRISSADSLELQTAGNVNQVFLSTNGNVGVGTNAPATTLDVAGNMRTVNFQMTGNNPVQGRVLTCNTIGQGFWSDLPVNNLYNNNGTLSGPRTVSFGSNSLTFNGSDIAGIAMNVGNVVINPTNVNNPLIFNNGNTGTNPRMFSNDTLEFQSGGVANQLVLNTNGNVGVNTNAPAAKLDVAGTMRIGTTTSGSDADSILTISSAGIVNKRSLSSVVNAPAANTFYNSNGTLTSARTVTQGTNNLLFTSAATTGIAAGSSFKIIGPDTATLEIQGNTHQGGGIISSLILGSYGANFPNGTNNRSVRLVAVDDGGGGSNLEFYTSNTSRVRIANNGNVGIGTTGAPGYKLDVAGDINASGSVRSGGNALTSDARLKRNIVTTSYGLATVMQLHPVQYEKKATITGTDYDRKEIGFIAQELRKVLPTLVTEGKDADKTLAVSYTEIIPVLTKAIQEQEGKIEALVAENTKFTAEVSHVKALEADLAALKTQNAALSASIAEMAALKASMAEMRSEMNRLVLNKVAGKKIAKK